MKNNKSLPILGTILGIILIVAALFFRQCLTRAVDGVIFGIGGSLLSVSLTELTSRILLEKNPAKANQVRIEQNDERNIQIQRAARTKTLELSRWLILALAFLSILADSPLWFTLSITLIYLLSYIIEWIYKSQLMKKM